MSEVPRKGEALGLLLLLYYIIAILYTNYLINAIKTHNFMSK